MKQLLPADLKSERVLDSIMRHIDIEDPRPPRCTAAVNMR